MGVKNLNLETVEKSSAVFLMFLGSANCEHLGLKFVVFSPTSVWGQASPNLVCHA